MTTYLASTTPTLGFHIAQPNCWAESFYPRAADSTLRFRIVAIERAGKTKFFVRHYKDDTVIEQFEVPGSTLLSTILAGGGGWTKGESLADLYDSMI